MPSRRNERTAGSEVARDQEAELVDTISTFYDDPLGFVMFAFPWGKRGTQLHDRDGPDQWQIDVLEDIGQAVRASGSDAEALRIAVASGHGIGKTALVAWIILWFASTRPYPQIVVTANTTNQLTGKTWRELNKWWRLSIHKHWFGYTATKFYLKDAADAWFASAVPWSKERSDAFAGTHEDHVLMIFDEASAIEDVIWEVAEGALTTAGAMWIAFGNPTKNAGRFRECFRKFRHRWSTRQIDSRTAKMANKRQIDQWIEDYGEDSDFVRVRVKGQFPRQAAEQFIGEEEIDLAVQRKVDEEANQRHPLIMAVDVARYGPDYSVILLRRGARILSIRKYLGVNTHTLTHTAAMLAQENDPDAIFVDGNGVGGGVVDGLRASGWDVIDVNGGGRAAEHRRYFNKRAEMYALTREWLRKEGSLWIRGERDEQLETDLTTPEYGFDKNNRIQLENKDDMRDRVGSSPDHADALAMTFFQPVNARNRGLGWMDRLMMEYQGLAPAGGTTWMAR